MEPYSRKFRRYRLILCAYALVFLFITQEVKAMKNKEDFQGKLILRGAKQLLFGFGLYSFIATYVDPYALASFHVWRIPAALTVSLLWLQRRVTCRADSTNWSPIVRSITHSSTTLTLIRSIVSEM